MRRLLLLFSLFALPALAQTIDIGPGQTYTNIGDALWSTYGAGYTVRIHAKTLLTAVTTGTPTQITFTGNTTSGSTTISNVSVAAAQDLWVGEGFTCGTNTPGNTAIKSISGTGPYTIVFISGSGTGAASTVTGQSCTGTGEVLTLTTSAGSIPNGSSFWYAGATACSTSVTTGCIEPTQVTCGAYGSGLYGTATGGTACTGSTVTISEAPSIPSGTTVYFLPPYYEKPIITGSGTSGSPYIIEGIADPTTGLLPVLDARNATTGPNMPHGGNVADSVDNYGYIIFAWNSAITSYPQYVTFEGFRWQNTQDGITVEYDGSNNPYTNVGGYGMRVNECVNCTLQNNEPIYNGVGIFGADNPVTNPGPNILQSLTVDKNHFYRNGALSGAHQTYIESRGIIYDTNFYDMPAYGSACNQLKDRSSGTIIRYNTFRPSARATDLVAAQNSAYDNVPMDTVNVPTGGFAANLTTLTFTSVAVTASTTSGSTTVTVSSGGSTLQDGMRLIGTGIPANAQIAFASSPTKVILNYPATSTCSGCSYTANTVQSINVGDRVGYLNGTSGWGYLGSGAPTMPTVASVNTGTNTITLNSPGIPAALAAGQVLVVISRQLNPYLQTFEYGNVFDWNQNDYYNSTGAPIHYGWDASIGVDSNFDRAGTLYWYDNTFVQQWDLSGSTGSTYGQQVFQTESDADTIAPYNNLWYVTKAPGSGNSPTYLSLAGVSAYTSTGLTPITWLAGGNSQIASSPSQGSGTSCGVTATGWLPCNATLDPNGSVTMSTITTESPASLYPLGISGSQFKLQAGSSAIGAASALPAAIASNTLGIDATPYFNPDGTARANVLDIGAWSYVIPVTTANYLGVSAQGVILQ